MNGSRRLLPWMPWPAALASLARRMTLMTSALLIAVVLGIVWLSHSRVVDAVSDSELARLQASADQLAATMYTQARRLSQDGARVASLPAIRAAALAPAGPPPTATAAAFAAEFARAPQVRAIGVWNARRELVSGRGPASAMALPDGALRMETAGAAVVGPLTRAGDSVVYAVTAPIAGLSGTTVGYVVVTRQLTGGSESAALMGGLVGRDARVLFGNADGGFFSDLVAPVVVPKTLPAAGTARAYMSSEGEELLGAASAVPETPWLVVVETPREGALSAASRFTIDSALIAGVLIILGALMSWLLIRRTMRPLGEVTAAARDIAGGDLTRRVDVAGNDEIAILADAFNQMVERVERSSDDLAARARQLETTNKELNESELKYRSLFEHMPDGIIVHRNERIIFANPSAVRILGFEHEADLANLRVLDLVAPGDRELVRERIGQIVNESRMGPTVEIRMQRPDRKLATVEATSMPLRIGGGAAVQTVLHDVSERRLLEEQFRQSQKMDAVGRLAGGVAHDFNNLLTVIQAHAEFALAETESEETRRADIEEIRRTAESAARLTRQLLTFSRKQALTPAHIDLNDAIAGMLGMIKRLIGDNIEVVTAAGEDLAGIWADPGQIQQVLLNLAVNARDAMPDGGVLRFETANIIVGEGYVGAASAIPAGDYVMLAVQDTGVGMTEDIRSRVFEPFFTTKPASRGTGLGLSTVYGIVQQSQGHIWVYSEPGMGTAFKVFFPPHHSLDSIHLRSSVLPQLMAGEQGHLLVVEDDASVRTAVVRALRAAGYTVTEACHADEAHDAIRRDATIELMITDMVMPGKPGTELLTEVRGVRPGLPAIVLSGYSEQAGTEVWRIPENAVFVEKPVSPAELVRRVRQLLAIRV